MAATEKNYIQLVNEELQCFKAKGIPYFFEETVTTPIKHDGIISNCYDMRFGQTREKAERFYAIASTKKEAKNIAFKKLFEKYFKN